MSIVLPSLAISLPSTKPSTFKSPDKLKLYALISPDAEILPVTLNPESSKPISKFVAESKFVASMLSAIIVLFDDNVPVKLPPESGRYSPKLPPPLDGKISARLTPPDNILPVTFNAPSITPPLANCLATLPPPDDISTYLFNAVMSPLKVLLISSCKASLICVSSTS